MVEKNSSQKHGESQKYAMLQWLNRNHKKLLAHYKGEYIAHNAHGILAHGENLQEVLEQANSFQEDYLIYVVPKRTASIQILTIYFRSVVRH